MADSDTFNDIPSAEDPTKYDFGERYEVIGKLGQGGMGTVLKARHRTLKKLVAIKVLNAAVILNADNRQRFEIEAQAGSKLSHPNLISVFDYGFIKAATPYLVMEYIEGESLDELLDRQGGKLDFAQFLDIFKQVNRALSYIHKNGIIHRDLKTSNIMIQVIDGERYVKLLDFGIAKILGDEGIAAQQLTKTGTVFGSPPYMSPEQCMGRKIDERSDIYSIGCVMYECVSGLPPLLGENSLQTLFKHANETPEPLPRGGAKETDDIVDVIHKCLETGAEKRFQTAAELLSALNNIVPTGGHPVVPPAPRPAAAAAHTSAPGSALNADEKNEISALWKKIGDQRPTSDMSWQTNPGIGHVERQNQTTENDELSTGSNFRQPTGAHSSVTATGSFTKKLREEMKDSKPRSAWPLWQAIAVPIVLVALIAVPIVVFGGGLPRFSLGQSSSKPFEDGNKSFLLGQDHFQDARENYARALKLAKGDDAIIGSIKSRLGRMALTDGNVFTADEYFSDSVKRLGKFKDARKDEYLDAVIGLGEIRSSKKLYLQAEEYYSDARKLAEEWQSDPIILGNILSASAKNARYDNKEKALYLYDQARAQYEKASQYPEDKIANSFIDSAQVRIKMGDNNDARSRLEKAKTACEDIKDSSVKFETQRRIEELLATTQTAPEASASASEPSSTPPQTIAPVEVPPAAASAASQAAPVVTVPGTPSPELAAEIARNAEWRAKVKLYEDNTRNIKRLSDNANASFARIAPQLESLRQVQSTPGAGGSNYSSPYNNSQGVYTPQSSGTWTPDMNKNLYDVGKNFSK